MDDPNYIRFLLLLFPVLLVLHSSFINSEMNLLAFLLILVATASATGIIDRLLSHLVLNFLRLSFS